MTNADTSSQVTNFQAQHAQYRQAKRLKGQAALDAWQRKTRRWYKTPEGARRYCMAALANGATTLPADKYRLATLYEQPSENRQNVNGRSKMPPKAETAVKGDPTMSSLLEYKLDLIARQLNAYVIEDVAVVMRRQFTREDGVDVTVIDFYPPWNAAGTFGKHKLVHEYIDHDWQRARFEKFTGVSIDSLPVYEASQALKRNINRPHPCEVAVRPFRLMLQPRQDADGNDLKTLILRYLPADRQPGQPDVGAPTPTASPPSPASRTVPAPAWAQPAPAAGKLPYEPPTVGAPTEPIDHMVMALAATTEEAFDYHAFMHFRNGTVKEMKNITWLRRQISGQWQPDGGEVNGRMVAAIDQYLKTRKEAEAAGKPATQCHKLAIGPARRVFQVEVAR